MEVHLPHPAFTTDFSDASGVGSFSYKALHTADILNHMGFLS